MQIKESRRERSIGENTLPMINVIFLLLVFFMLAGTIEKSLNVTPPTSHVDEAEQLNELNIEIHANGDIYLSGQKTDRDLLALAIHQLLRSQVTPVKSIQVLADAELPAWQLQALLTTLASTELESVKLITRKA